MPAEQAKALRLQAREVVAGWGTPQSAEEAVLPVRRMLDAAVQRALDHGFAPERVEAYRARLEARIDRVEDMIRETGGELER